MIVATCLLFTLMCLYFLIECGRSYYNPIEMNKTFILNQVDTLMLKLMNEKKYKKLSHRWRDKEITVVHNDVETFTYDNSTIYISLANTMERNTRMYAMLHELTHIQLESTDHGVKFMNEFELLLRHAEEIGIYTEVSLDDLYAGRSLSNY
jgi:hypothetical protein